MREPSAAAPAGPLPPTPDRDWRVSDLAWIGLLFLLLIASGYGFRDPWPADEPRFASLARDMVYSGDWLFPRVGGDLYQDKPPLFFWLLAASYALIGTVRWSFLLPSMIAAASVLVLVYDLARRLHGRQAGLCAALLLGCSLQFVITMRGAQIDPTLLGLTTLSLYALARHLLLGPAWGWYAVAGLAAGLGVIAKGVGFLPLLALLVFAGLRRWRWNGLARVEGGGWRWSWAAFGFLLAVALWIGPMLWFVARSGAPELIAYRDEILFQQTVQRYAAAWHHNRPWYYFLVEVIPVLWLPASALLFWLVPRWRADWRARRAQVWLFLGWTILVLVFFSLSTGKRGVYIQPALPALVLAAAPHLPELFARRGVGRASLALAALFVVAGIALGVGHLVGWRRAAELIADADLPSATPVLLFMVLSITAWALAAWKRPVAAWPAVLAVLAVCWGYGVAPHMNAQRSGQEFMRETLARVAPDEEVALVAYKEQFLLWADRDTVNFGHRRWREGTAESADAAAWLAAAPNRVVVLPEGSLAPCFVGARRELASDSRREVWWLVRGTPDPGCVAKGDARRAIRYPGHPIG